MLSLCSDWRHARTSYLVPNRTNIQCKGRREKQQRALRPRNNCQRVCLLLPSLYRGDIHSAIRIVAKSNDRKRKGVLIIFTLTVVDGP